MVGHEPPCIAGVSTTNVRVCTLSDLSQGMLSQDGVNGAQLPTQSTGEHSVYSQDTCFVNDSVQE